MGTFFLLVKAAFDKKKTIKISNIQRKYQALKLPQCFHARKIMKFEKNFFNIVPTSFFIVFLNSTAYSRQPFGENKPLF